MSSGSSAGGAPQVQPTDGAAGQIPTATDLMWERAALELSPEKTLERVTANAKSVVSTVGVVGVLLGALGLLTTAVIQGNTLLLGAAYATSALATAAVTLALFTLIARNAEVAVGNLADVEKWYLNEIRRKRGAAWASALLFCAGLLATLVVVMGGIQEVGTSAHGDAKNHLQLSVVTTGKGSTIRLAGSVSGLTQSQTVSVRVEVAGAPVIEAVSYPDDSGSAALDVSGAATKQRELPVAVVRILDSDGTIATQMRLGTAG